MPFPDLTAPELAYPMFTQQDINPKQITKVSGVYLKNMDMPELVEKVLLAVYRADAQPTSCRKLGANAEWASLGESELMPTDCRREGR
jgi:hypothetical protein